MYVDIKRSNRPNKKYMAIFYDTNKKKVSASQVGASDLRRIKTVHFGAVGYEDFTTHKDEFRKRKYISRHSNENWNDYMTAGSLSGYVLWNKETIEASISDYMKKFGLKSL